MSSILDYFQVKPNPVGTSTAQNTSLSNNILMSPTADISQYKTLTGSYRFDIGNKDFDNAFDNNVTINGVTFTPSLLIHAADIFWGNAMFTDIKAINELSNITLYGGSGAGIRTTRDIIAILEYLLSKVNSVPTITYSIIWDGNGATTQSSGGSSSVNQGESVIIPTTNPKRVHNITWNANGGSGNTGGTSTVTYSFKGWYTTKTGTTQVTSSTVPTANSTYYAQWTAPSSISLPSNPTREGFNFNGWFTTATGTTQVTPSRIPTTDVTYYAHWTQIANEYYWYVGQDTPTSESSVIPQDNETFTNNNWHTLNVNNTYTFSNPIYNSESNPISGDSNTYWYVALPADKSYSIYDSDDANDISSGNWIEQSPIIVANVNYKVYKKSVGSRRFAAYWIH